MRLREYSEFLEPANITHHDIDALGKLLDGFDTEFFEKISDDAIANSTALVWVNFTSNAKVILLVDLMLSQLLANIALWVKFSADDYLKYFSYIFL